jgi:hypothetical protein
MGVFVYYIKYIFFFPTMNPIAECSLKLLIVKLQPS